MIRSSGVVLATLLVSVSAGAATARDLSPPKGSYTDVEQTLCQPDVFRLCNDYVPDEDRIIACMKAKQSQLSPDCRKVFVSGLKKRGQ